MSVDPPTRKRAKLLGMSPKSTEYAGGQFGPLAILGCHTKPVRVRMRASSNTNRYGRPRATAPRGCPSLHTIDDATRQRMFGRIAQLADRRGRVGTGVAGWTPLGRGRRGVHTRWCCSTHACRTRTGGVAAKSASAELSPPASFC